jgi:radical SAM protein
LNFQEKPVLVFWETTRACQLSCIHCRASAIKDPLPNELTHEEGIGLLDRITLFGKPYPTVIFTGGDPLMRKDIMDLMSCASKIGLNFAASPAVSSLLTSRAMQEIKDAGASSISVSLDGQTKETHDDIRIVEGTFERTIETMRRAKELGLPLQVNTTVMKRNLRELPMIFHLIKSLGVRVWEVFFLIRTGRGAEELDLSPEEYESVCNFLYDASHYGVVIRCVEAPFIRRVLRQRRLDSSGGAVEYGYLQDKTYQSLKTRLEELEGGQGKFNTSLGQKGTLDGDGIVFVGYDGKIKPGGLVPVEIGNVREDDLVNVYRNDELLRKIRSRKMNGICGECDFMEFCGGSRARAFASCGDPLSSDPACVYSSKNKQYPRDHCC